MRVTIPGMTSSHEENLAAMTLVSILYLLPTSGSIYYQ